MFGLKKLLFIFGITLILSCQDNDIASIEIELNENWEFKQTDSLIWRSAEVPGCIHTDLFNHNIIEDPYTDTNENNVQWIEIKDWEYETTFNLSEEILEKENIEIIFEGLDTYASVKLNDSNILKSDNLFITYIVDCKALLKEKNTLQIQFKSSIHEAQELWKEYPHKLPGGQKVMTRKAGFHYGWDWGPRLVTSGIWRPIKIHAWNNFKINDIFISTSEISENNAKLNVNIEIDAVKSTHAELIVSYKDNILQKNIIKINTGKQNNNFTLNIKNPKLWWTNGLGAPFLYDLLFTLKENNEIIDTETIKYGIRTIELIKEKDELGETFFFKLNGIPVFMKGANYIPQDNFQNRVSKKNYNQLFETVVKSNMNMLRVWGGGIYEEDYFYELCNKNGILVWQDFMFACAMYPSNNEFLKSVQTEAEQNIKCLRNHPSIALWCGNNEIDEAWQNWGWSNTFSKEDSAKIWQGYDTLFHHIIPNTVKKHDSNRPYHSSSPQYGRGSPISQFVGDSHYWGVWHDAEPFENYEKKVPRFMSEFGFQSFPSIKTIRTFASEKDMFIDSDVMLSHQKHPRGNELIKKYLNDYYSIPDNFEHFVYLSQLMQAEGVSLGIEAHRRAMPYCMGTLYWQLNDCWPVVSWSGTDYYGNWKALQYFVKKAYEKYLISFENENENLKIFIVSDDLKKINAKLNLKLSDFKGNILWSYSKQIQIQANASEVYYTVDLKKVLQNYNKSDIVLTAELLNNDSIITYASEYFVKPKNLNLQKTEIKYSIKKKNTAYEITLNSDNLIKNLHLNTVTNGFFSENYFDLHANQEKRIIFYTENKSFNKDKIQIVSLNDVLNK